MAFRVVIADGPAEGWSYVTLISPDQVIVLAPNPTRDGDWMRVLPGPEPWPGQLIYTQGVGAGSSIDDDGDLCVPYEHRPA